MSELPRALSGVSAMLSARHTDPHMGEGEHAHVWSFTVWWLSEPLRDGRIMRAALETILSPYQGKTLPEELWSAESLAALVFAVMGNIVRVDVSRPEGFYASVEV